MVGPNLPFGGLACGLVLGPLPSFHTISYMIQEDLHEICHQRKREGGKW